MEALGERPPGPAADERTSGLAGAGGCTPAQRLRVVAGDRDEPLPAWAQWLVRLGAWVSGMSPPDGRAVAAVTVPTRRYAAVLAALGAHWQVYRSLPETDPRARFEWLASLPPGTPMRWILRRQIRNGALAGVERKPEGDLLVLANPKEAIKYKLPVSMAPKVEPLQTGQELRARPRRVEEASGLAGTALGVDAQEHQSRSGLDCLLVGPRQHLEEELRQAEFAAGRARGSIQDLIRCRSLLPGQRGYFRTDLVAGQAQELPPAVDEHEVQSVVMDGPAAYLNWRDRFGRAPRLVLLDRTQLGAAPAAEEILAARAMSLRLIELAPVGPVPAGMEAVAFVEVEVEVEG